MTLQSWLSNGWLKKHETSTEEIQALLEKVERDIKEASKEEITADWRLSIAYNACLGSATIALRASGYRIPSGGGHHYRTIQSLNFTLNPEQNIILTLEAIGKKRGIVNYDSAGTVTDAEVKESILLARDIYKLLKQWLKSRKIP